ncbi:hypothetical protein cyc_05172 [Cyclospora cayetanensis]|uniref:TPPC8 first Ig-like domain-containing protein n=1 Tax=Cyclospora cayetanensis TaxID=88456 RepID=A0A1D3DAA5_9EIME|nr:hypothetical protein cyc_05172 [Cyclospora cayetanensis]
MGKIFHRLSFRAGLALIPPERQSHYVREFLFVCRVLLERQRLAASEKVVAARAFLDRPSEKFAQGEDFTSAITLDTELRVPILQLRDTLGLLRNSVGVYLPGDALLAEAEGTLPLSAASLPQEGSFVSCQAFEELRRTTAVGLPVTVELRLMNPLSLRIELSNLRLFGILLPRGGLSPQEEAATPQAELTEAAAAQQAIAFSTVNVALDPTASASVRLTATPLKPGRLCLQGIVGELFRLVRVAQFFCLHGSQRVERRFDIGHCHLDCEAEEENDRAADAEEGRCRLQQRLSMIRQLLASSQTSEIKGQLSRLLHGLPLFYALHVEDFRLLHMETPIRVFRWDARSRVNETHRPDLRLELEVAKDFAFLDCQFLDWPRHYRHHASKSSPRNSAEAAVRQSGETQKREDEKCSALTQHQTQTPPEDAAAAALKGMPNPSAATPSSLKKPFSPHGSDVSACEVRETPWMLAGEQRECFLLVRNDAAARSLEELTVAVFPQDIVSITSATLLSEAQVKAAVEMRLGQQLVQMPKAVQAAALPDGLPLRVHSAVEAIFAVAPSLELHVEPRLSWRVPSQVLFLCRFDKLDAAATRRSGSFPADKDAATAYAAAAPTHGSEQTQQHGYMGVAGEDAETTDGSQEKLRGRSFGDLLSNQGSQRLASMDGSSRTALSLAAKADAADMLPPQPPSRPSFFMKLAFQGRSLHAPTFSGGALPLAEHRKAAPCVPAAAAVYGEENADALFLRRPLFLFRLPRGSEGECGQRLQDSCEGLPRDLCWVFFTAKGRDNEGGGIEYLKANEANEKRATLEQAQERESSASARQQQQYAHHPQRARADQNKETRTGGVRTEGDALALRCNDDDNLLSGGGEGRVRCGNGSAEGERGARQMRRGGERGDGV